jgi:hypothetical protein
MVSGSRFVSTRKRQPRELIQMLNYQSDCRLIVYQRDCISTYRSAYVHKYVFCVGGGRYLVAIHNSRQANILRWPSSFTCWQTRVAIAFFSHWGPIVLREMDLVRGTLKGTAAALKNDRIARGNLQQNAVESSPLPLLLGQYVCNVP